LEFYTLFASKAGGKMPKQKLKLTKTEDQEYGARLLRLEEIGIQAGSVCHPSPEPDRLTLEQIEHDFARIYELPSGMVAVVVPVKIVVLVSGILITDFAITIPRIDCPLELSDPAENKYYPDLIDQLPYTYTGVTLLNDYLTSGVPLRPRQVKGVIIAEGWTSVPTGLHDDMLEKVELSMQDERHNELCFDFQVRGDSTLLLRYQRLQRKHYERIRLAKAGGLFEKEQLGDVKSISPHEAVNFRDASDEGEGELDNPN
jgi:hypothetical protein